MVMMVMMSVGMDRLQAAVCIVAMLRDGFELQRSMADAMFF